MAGFSIRDHDHDHTGLHAAGRDVQSPTATVAPARGPDSNGWYNHPVASALSASSFSGIASCSSTTYAGPNTAGATVSGTCTDNAGKTVDGR